MAEESMRTRKPISKRPSESVASLRSKLARSQLMVATAQSQAQRLARENQRLRSDVARLSGEVKAAEDAKEQTERFLNDAQQLSRTGSFIANFTTKLHLWSDETYRLYEYEPSMQPTPELVLARVHPDDRAALRENFSRRDLREPLDIRYRMLMPDGRIKHIRVLGRAIDAPPPGATYAGALMDVTEARLAEDALRASEQLARGQVEALKGALDALATEVAPDRLAGLVLRAITEQFGAQGSSAWCCDHASGMIGLEFAFEDGRVITKDDARSAGMDLWLPIEDLWAEVFRTGKPFLAEDIRKSPAFPLRDRLLAMGIATLLLIPMSVGGRVDGVIALRFTQARTFRPEEMELAQALANQAMLIIQFTRLSTQSRDAAIVAERNRIARDIHDTLAQGFTGVIVQLEAAEDATARGFAREAHEHLARARDLARESLNEARRSVHALRPRALDGAGLSDALAKLFENMTRGTGLQSEFSVVGQPIALPPDWEENLFRVGQEILTNALRHANANRFTAKMIFLPDAVRLDLRDDGRGFDPKARSDGFGLLGIRERVEAMGGQVTVRSAPGEGTSIVLTPPRPDTAQGELR
jgi:signal transduction histidine kinase